MQPLFLPSSSLFEKTSAQTQLSEDPNSWPNELLQELYKQAPYVADFSPHVVMEKVDGEKGYGLGHVEIGNQTEVQTAVTPDAMRAAGLRQVRVPVIIKDGMLAPFDLLITEDSKVLPLTETRLRAAIFRPQAFDVTSRTPGDQSMIGQLYPPYRQSYGFGGGGGLTTNMGMGKEGSALASFLSEGQEKTASEFQNFADHYLSEDYLHGATQKQVRAGKKEASGDAYPGMFEEFIQKNAAPKEDGNRKFVNGMTAAGGLVGGAAGFHGSSGMSGKARAIATGAGALLGAGAGRVAGHIQKDASALGAVNAALAGRSVAHQAAKNTAAAKSSATAAMVRAKNLATKIKKASLLEAIRPSIYESHLTEFKQAITDPNVQVWLYKNAGALVKSIDTLMSAEEQPKFASHFAHLIRPSVVQLRLVDDGYRVKSASHLFWEPVIQTIDRGEALRRFGEKIVLAAEMSGAVTLADGAEAVDPEHDSDMQDVAPITEPGLYKVQTHDGEEAVGYVIPNLIDIDGTELPLSLFTNGTQATVQGDIVGCPVEGGGMDLPSADTPNGRGVFASSDGTGAIKATVPLTIEASMAGVAPGEPVTYRGESFTGEQVLISVQPNIQTVVGTDDGKMLVPMDWQWVPLGSADAIALESQEDGAAKTASLRLPPHVEVVSAGGSTYSLRGSAVAKLAHAEREQLGLDDVMFLLAGLGVEQGYGLNKLAQASTGAAPVKVCVGREIKLASDEMCEASDRAREVLAVLPQLRQPLFKEAAALGDPQAVDAVLALGFINPENLTTFIGYLPVLEDAQTKLCDILLASRLGSLIETPEGAIERSVRSTEAVLEGLKALAFQQN